MKNKPYKHKKTGKTYIVKDFPQLKVDNEWVEGILYSEFDLFTFKVFPAKYVRTKEDFLNKFKEIDFSSERKGA